MSNRRSIDNANKLFFFVAAIAIALLAGHCQGDEFTKKEKEFRVRAELIGLHFTVQKRVLEIFYKKATQFANIFDTNHQEETKGIRKTLVWILSPQKKKKEEEEKQYLSYLDGLLAKALPNLLSDAKSIYEWILRAFPKFNLDALKQWLDLADQQQQELKSSEDRLDEANMPQEHPYTKLLFKPEQVNPILRELDPVLEQMTSSTHRAEWRKDVEKMFAALISNDSELKEQYQQKLNQVNDQRVDYDSMYVQLAIVRATFHTGKIAYAEMEGVEEKKKAAGKNKIVKGEKKKADENQQEEATAAATTIAHQQQMAQELVITVEHMKNYADNMEMLRAQMDNLNNLVWDSDEQNELRKSKLNIIIEGYDKLGFNGSAGFHFNKAHGDMEKFAQMLVKKPYVPAVNGPEVVLKYQLMLNFVTVWKLRDDVIAYIDNDLTNRLKQVAGVKKNAAKQVEHQKDMDKKSPFQLSGGEDAYNANRSDFYNRPTAHGTG